MDRSRGNPALIDWSTRVKGRIPELLRFSPLRGALERAGDTRPGRRWLNRIAGANGVFSTFPEAHRAAANLGVGGHEEPTQSECYSHIFRQSDYPVLYWLSRIAPRRLLDFGGALGALHDMYRDYLDEAASIDWMVYDLPEIVQRAKCRERRPDSPLRFTSDLSDGAGCDVLLASGSLHYWEQSLGELFSALGDFPKHVLINRSPVTDRSSYLVVQRLPQAAMACLVRNRAALIEEFGQLGYALVDRWIEPGRGITIPLFPRYDVQAYSGFYFRLKDGLK